MFDTVRETGDHGSFNSWGRDRYWGLKDAPADELPQLALLDAVKPTVLRNNRWRCDHGWDVDLDDGSSNYEIYNNLFLHGGLKLREGFHRRVWNNITVNNSLHPHVWYDNSGDEVTKQHLDGRATGRPAACPRASGARRSTATSSPRPTPTARRSPPTAAMPIRWSATRCSSIRPTATTASKTARPP